MGSASNGSASEDRKLKALFRFIELLAIKNRLDPEKAVNIFKLLLEASEKKGVSDEDISTKMNYRQSDVRRILRTFYVYRLADYRRGKHPKTGATRYYWYVDLNRLNIILVWMKKMVVEKLCTRLQYEEENVFYVCPRDGTRYTFDEAYNYEFVCPKCGSILEEEDNSKIKKILREYIEWLEEEIKEDEAKIRAS